jgi:hypothetical protein
MTENYIASRLPMDVFRYLILFFNRADPSAELFWGLSRHSTVKQRLEKEVSK